MHINYTGNRNKLSFNYKGLDYYYHTNPLYFNYYKMANLFNIYKFIKNHYIR